jgi:hypothetical protein
MADKKKPKKKKTFIRDKKTGMKRIRNLPKKNKTRSI